MLGGGGGGFLGHESLEERNQEMEGELKGKISALKSLSIDIGMEVREQNRYLLLTWEVVSSPPCRFADPGCLYRIPDPTFFHPGSRIQTVSIPDPGSRILIKELYFNPKKNKKMVSKL